MSCSKFAASTYLLLFSLLLLLAAHLASPQSASAYYGEIEAEKLSIPSFDVVGAIPLTQVGSGHARKVGRITPNRSAELLKALAHVIPADWNYFVSKKAPFCTNATWGEGKSTWVHALEHIAESSKTRILIDWNYKSILVLSQDERGAETVFVNPRAGIDNASVVDFPSDSPLQTLDIQVSKLPECKPKTNPLCPSQRK